MWHKGKMGLGFFKKDAFYVEALQQKEVFPSALELLTTNTIIHNMYFIQELRILPRDFQSLYFTSEMGRSLSVLLVAKFPCRLNLSHPRRPRRGRPSWPPTKTPRVHNSRIFSYERKLVYQKVGPRTASMISCVFRMEKVKSKQKYINPFPEAFYSSYPKKWWCFWLFKMIWPSL